MTLVLLSMEFAETWKETTSFAITPVEVDDKAIAAQHVEKVDFYPPVPAALPDLYEGYLFNQDRFLAEPGETVAEQSDDTGEDIDLGDVTYVGSLIMGSTRQGIITYPDPETTVTKRRVTRGRSRISKRAAALKARRGKTRRLSRQVNVGDNFSGYEIDMIQPDQIVFVRDEERVEIDLYDPDKDRIVLPARPSVPQKRQVRKTVRKAPAATGKRNVPRAPVRKSNRLPFRRSRS